MADPVAVLFVCLGNICRSPIGDIDSCGTGAYHAGDAPDSRSLDVLRDHGVTEYQHQARKIRVPDDFVKFDYILAMDRDNLTDLQDLARRSISKGQLPADAINKIHLYGEFGNTKKPEEINDPYYGGAQGFEQAFAQATRFGRGLLEHIEKQAAKSDNKI